MVGTWPPCVAVWAQRGPVASPALTQRMRQLECESLSSPCPRVAVLLLSRCKTSRRAGKASSEAGL
ncbi:hypothetical protein H8959_012085 [Pygathrix nigripes]